MKHYFNYDLAEKLCKKAHGSGLDTEPCILDAYAMRYVQITWEFHLMDELGFYDGYWRFVLKIPRDNPMEFTLNGRSGNPRSRSARGIKEYLEDIFAELIPEILQEGGVSFDLVNEKIYPGDPDYNANMPFAQEHGYHYGRAARYEYSGELQEDQHV
jgi:hypothetical protein